MTSHSNESYFLWRCLPRTGHQIVRFAKLRSVLEKIYHTHMVHTIVHISAENIIKILVNYQHKSVG